MQRSTVSRTSFGSIANTLAGSTPGLIVPIARTFVVGVDVVMGCAYPEFGPKRLKISIRPAKRTCFIYLLHNFRRLVPRSNLRPLTSPGVLALRQGNDVEASQCAKAARREFSGTDQKKRP